jgi:hypothetical protein
MVVQAAKGGGGSQAVHEAARTVKKAKLWGANIKKDA